MVIFMEKAYEKNAKRNFLVEKLAAMIYFTEFLKYE